MSDNIRKLEDIPTIMVQIPQPDWTPEEAAYYCAKQLACNIPINNDEEEQV